MPTPSMPIGILPRDSETKYMGITMRQIVSIMLRAVHRSSSSIVAHGFRRVGLFQRSYEPECARRHTVGKRGLHDERNRPRPDIRRN
jgi:hypothetical protein